MRSAGATILHADADAFFASVEQRDNPALRGRPVIVGPGVVMAASYEARACGIRGGMGGRQARLLCPQAVTVPPRFDAYVEASRALFRVFRDTAPLVEGLSLEEAFLDVRGLGHISGTPVEIARRLRREVREQIDLPVTVGVARTKVLAKMASRAAKPDGLLVVEPGEELEFLHPLGVHALWGVGSVTGEKLHRHGITTVGQLAAIPETVLMSIVGRATGRHLHAIANNRDPRRVRPDSRRRSFGAQSAFGRGRRSRAQINAIVVELVDRVTTRMRRKHRAGRTVVLRLRFDDFSRATRSRTLPHATASSQPILAAARSLLARVDAVIERRGLTLVGIAVSNLDDVSAGVQLPLPFERRVAPELDYALDEIRERFGSAAVRRGRDLRLPPER